MKVHILTNSKIHYYPDGSSGLRKPRDGERFVNRNSDGTDDEWTYDDFMEKWVKLKKSHTFNNKESEKYDINKSISCECGSEKVGSSKHSFWCPKALKS